MQKALLDMGVMDTAAAAALIKNVDEDGDGRIRCAQAAAAHGGAAFFFFVSN